jgi:signal transduction histidine kinase
MKTPDLNRFIIGPRLSFTFAVLIALIVGGNGLLLWQFHIAREQTDRLNAVSQQVISVLRLEGSLRSFHQQLDEIARTRDARRLAEDIPPLRASLLQQTQRTGDAVTRIPAEIKVDPALLPTLEAIEITLPSRLDAITALAASDDWEAVRRRLANEFKPLETQTSALIQSIDQEVTAELTLAVARMNGVQRRIFFIVPATAIVTLLIAGFLGWAITRRIILLRLEERIEERTRIARELHDTLLQGVISASMQLHIAVDGLPQDSPARPAFARILQLTGQVIDEGRNAVRGFRASDRETSELGGALSRVPQELNFQNRTDFRVIVEGHQQPLHPVIRDEVYAICREALVNALRHSKASNIRVDVEYSPSHLRVLVGDDGCGIDTEVQATGRDGHWGLSGMRERTQRIGGKLKILSRAGAGTEVELRVPGEIAFESYASSASRWFGGFYRRLAATTVDAHHR